VVHQSELRAAVFKCLYKRGTIRNDGTMGDYRVEKIVSGGQTGVDRAALDVAIFREIPHGGWCPKGRRAEDGAIPEIYQLKETDSIDYSIRTEQNVIESDGTLILYSKVLKGGTELTRRFAKQHQRPHLCIDLSEPDNDRSSQTKTRIWLADHNIGVLNIAGPRASSCAEIAKRAESFLLGVFEESNI